MFLTLAIAVALHASPIEDNAPIQAAESLVGDPIRGEDVFNRCRACHSLTASDNRRACKVGPTLLGLFGRAVGTIAKCEYSAALANADFIWTPERLDQWLQSPAGYLPGNRMAFQSLSDPQERADLIAFLANLTDNK